MGIEMDKIPKTIHYCWFGKGKKSKLFKKCIKTWRNVLPDYEIIEWNEENFDINSNLYVKQAYNAKKYEFVSDYVRMYVLYNYGGIYMDTDVEVLKPLNKFLNYTAFIGFEEDKFCGTSIIGSEKENVMIKKFLDSYNDISFVRDDGSFDETTNVNRITKILLEHGLKFDNTQQNVKDISVFPKTYFSPLNFDDIKTDFSDNTYTIHHFAGSWLPKEVKNNIKIKKKCERRKKFLCNFMSERNATIISELRWIVENKIKKLKS